MHHNDAYVLIDAIKNHLFFRIKKKLNTILTNLKETKIEHVAGNQAKSEEKSQYNVKEIIFLVSCCL